MRIGGQGCFCTALVVVSVFSLLGRSVSAGQQPEPAPPTTPTSARPSLTSHPLQQPPTIDGVLDDDAWRVEPAPTGNWLSYNPLHGEKVPQATRIWIAHDSNFLYFAFQCDDPDPSTIKTSITKR